MRIPGAKLATHSTRWLRSQVFAHGLILGYHRIADVSADPYRICVSPRHFAEHLDVLKRCARPVRLWDLIDEVQARRSRRGAIAITFDDGYADLLSNAKPLLDGADMPATAFVVAGGLGRPFWWDELAALLVAPDGNAAQRDEHEVGAEAELPAAYRSLRYAPPAERERRLTELRGRAAGEDDGPDPLARSLTGNELALLSDDGLITVGAHSFSHASLGGLPRAEQQYEISASKRELERLLSRPVRGFSYPDGSLTEETVELVKDSDFRYACASHEDAVYSKSDTFRLPRFWPGDWDGARFEEWLQRWL